MKTAVRTALVSVLAATALDPAPASAQAASEEVKRACRRTADQVASMIESAKKRGIRNLEDGVRKPSDSWASQVAHYMIQSASRADYLSEAELASLGYSYCVERRPRD